MRQLAQASSRLEVLADELTDDGVRLAERRAVAHEPFGEVGRRRSFDVQFVV